MTRFRGTIGYVIGVETGPGIITDSVTEKSVSGDILRNATAWSQTENLNPDFTITNRFSVVSDTFLQGNLKHIAYIEWCSQKWKVQTVEMVHPRAIITVRGLYNG